MDTARFDDMARLLARRSARRSALGAAVGITSAIAGADSVSATATKSQEDAAERSSFLFLQVFTHGAIAPGPDNDGLFTLTLSHPASQTVFFSDRPERIVGTVPTERFLEGLGFSPLNPPNAALVAHSDTGQDIFILELFNPRFNDADGTSGSATVVYDVRLLPSDPDAGIRPFAEQRSDTELPSAIGPASLFVDDCSDIVHCVIDDPSRGQLTIVGDIPGGPYGTCWSWSSFSCNPCSHDYAYYDNICNTQMDGCHAGPIGFCGASI